MIATVDKDERTPLCAQLKSILIDEIRSGALKAGKRIPGERVIAEKYGVSRGTAVEALKLLENDGYLERVATRGTFVAGSADERLKTVNILFPFPETAISRDIINYSNWVMDTETHHGLLEGAGKYNVSINLQHFEVSDEPSIIMGQVKKIRSFDAAFFIGRQFSSLIDALNFECVPCIVSDTAAPSGYPLTISYQRKKAIKDCADYLAGCGYRRLGLIMNEKRTSNGDWKMAYFQECAETRGVTIKNDKIYCVSENEEDAVKRLLERLPRSKENLPDAFFCEAMTAPLAFLRAAHERGWTVGRDIGLMGYAGETALRNTIPSVTYLRIPYTEMGSEACRLLREKILRKHNDIVHHEIPARIVEGESTRKI